MGQIVLSIVNPTVTQNGYYGVNLFDPGTGASAIIYFGEVGWPISYNGENPWGTPSYPTYQAGKLAVVSSSLGFYGETTTDPAIVTYDGEFPLLAFSDPGVGVWTTALTGGSFCYNPANGPSGYVYIAGQPSVVSGTPHVFGSITPYVGTYNGAPFCGLQVQGYYAHSFYA